MRFSDSAVDGKTLPGKNWTVMAPTGIHNLRVKAGHFLPAQAEERRNGTMGRGRGVSGDVKCILPFYMMNPPMCWNVGNQDKKKRMCLCVKNQMEAEKVCQPIAQGLAMTRRLQACAGQVATEALSVITDKIMMLGTTAAPG